MKNHIGQPIAVVFALVVVGYFWYTLQLKRDTIPAPLPAAPSTEESSSRAQLCRDALALTTFTDGAAAEAYVAACTRGDAKLPSEVMPQ